MPPIFTDDDLDDIEHALRIAAACIELTGRHFDPPEDEINDRDLKRAQVALGRQANRFRSLARRVINKRT